MLPSILARELQDSVRKFLRATFPMTTPLFRRGDGGTMLEDFLAEPGALFKGPYLDLGLPFRKAAADESLPFEHVRTPFTPFRHQVQAFNRLAGPAPKSTLIATGTGSGKTECYFLPILDHCSRSRGQGIKALIIYPMNALANDQARRFAREIHGQKALKGRVSVGLYVGERESSPHKAMTDTQVITSKDALRDNPPDILLTNYKMLDFLLLRPRDQKLWRFNKPGVLRFLVVDELHTFDGAQGTDLACLIRRLRDRLGAGPELACAGTSATLGGKDAEQDLLQYAKQVFAADFEADAVILEDRQAVGEFLGTDVVEYTQWLPAGSAARLQPADFEDMQVYLRAQAELWFGEAAPALDDSSAESRREAHYELARKLRRHEAFRWLLGKAAASGLIDVAEAVRELAQRFRVDEETGRAALDSLVALVSAARVKMESTPQDQQNDPSTSFVQVRSQLWLRELRRLVASVDPQRPMLRYADDLPDHHTPLHLPVVHCRECHAVGWGAMKRDDEGRIESKLQEFYQGYFGDHPEVCLLFPLIDAPPHGSRGLDCALCPGCGRLQPYRPGQSCQGCGEEDMVHVWRPSMTSNVRTRDGANFLKSHHNCPFCGAREGLSLMGSRAASLSSVLIGELFSSTYNDHHKLIAFSDSVQDAAHRAGFFGARTYGTLVRTAIARVLREIGEGMSLARLAEAVPQYWRGQTGDDAEFSGTFIAPNMTWLRGYQSLLETRRLEPDSDLPELVSLRLKWEVLQGFGLRTRIGRTLERTRTGVVGVDMDRLAAVAEGLRVNLSEELEVLRGIDHAAVMRFLLGLLWRMRTQGAFYDPMLDDYIRQRGKTYQFYRTHHMPNYGRASPPPAFLTLEHVSDNFENLGNADAGWYLAWFNKVLGADWVAATAEYRQAISLTLDQLTRTGLLRQLARDGDGIWGLDPDHWLCSSRVAELACAQCGHRIQAPEQQVDAWRELHCLQAPCAGAYRALPEEPAYSPYLRGTPRRLVPSEHTAILDDEMRRDIEDSFIYGQRSWDINLLSATPTLELGINIGDLSSILLCSVPPTQQNYIQRVGRAGRRDGNALAVTVANGDKHDLFFYAQPQEMIAGQIRTPGVFLAATAVLERQLIAFCFDRWAASGIDERAIPSRLKAVLDGITTTDPNRFPHNLLAFIKEQQHVLLKDFCGLFPELSEEARQHLDVFLTGDNKGAGIEYRLTNRLYGLVAERDALQARVKKLDGERKRLEKLPEDDLVKEQLDMVRNERNAVLGLLRSINNKATLNFFTDEGLLPNYAFPEEGVILQSVILRRRERTHEEEDKGGRYYRETLEFQRPAVAALSELAPANRFYARGHVVEIDQVDLSLDRVEHWRLCDQCPYVENVDLEDRNSVCPRCGSSQWADAGQKHELLRLRQVYAVAGERESLIDDDSDQRAPVFFKRQVLVDIEPGRATKAFRLDDETLPFGFEFVPSATFREINFGQAERGLAQFLVAGDLASRPGFRICRHCGKVRKPNERRARAHAIDCRLRRTDVQETEDDYFDSLYLFRELKSEALRILLPLAEVAGSEIRLHSLIAALQLGLRQYFRGNVDHLHAAYYAEPQGNTRKHYLVLYDRIPGGTGYLKELLRAPANLMKLLQIAYDTLAKCECNQDPDKDGCYRCLYAYRESRHMDKISRNAAHELLGRILKQSERLVEVEGLHVIDVSTLLESELEHRFVEALKNAGGGLQVTPELVNGKPGNYITISREGHQAMAWRLEPQVMLGPKDGAALNCEADFILWPARSGLKAKPVAVFMDGYQYHHDRVADDTAKRQALLDGGRFAVWNLGWHDIPEPGRKVDGAYLSYLRHATQLPMQQAFDKLADQSGWETFMHYDRRLEAGPFAWLVHYLAEGDAAVHFYRQAALSRLIAWLRQETVRDKVIMEACATEMRSLVPRYMHEQLFPEGDSIVLGGLLDTLGTALPPVSLVVSIPADALRSREALIESARCHLAFDESDRSDEKRYERAWRAFWNLAVLFQFAPTFSMASTLGVRDDRYVVQTDGYVAAAEMETVAGDWREIAEFSFFGEQVLALAKAELPEPIVGFELADAKGKVLAEAVDLAWPAFKLAIVEGADAARDSKWITEGWTLFTGLDDNVIVQLKLQITAAREA